MDYCRPAFTKMKAEADLSNEPEAVENNCSRLSAYTCQFVVCNRGFRCTIPTWLKITIKIYTHVTDKAEKKTDEMPKYTQHFSSGYSIPNWDIKKPSLLHMSKEGKPQVYKVY